MEITFTQGKRPCPCNNKIPGLISTIFLVVLKFGKFQNVNTSVFPDRAGDTSVQRTWSMITSRRDGVDATMSAPYMQLYFPAIRKDFIRNAQNSMCMQYFSADELTTGEIPEMENTQQPPRCLPSPAFGDWSNLSN